MQFIFMIKIAINNTSFCRTKKEIKITHFSRQVERYS